MAENQWEYCHLGLDGDKYHKPDKRTGNVEGWSYDCHIYYYGPSKSQYIQLTRLDTIVDFTPFPRAMALLGLYGWELVSVQHPVYGAHGGSDGDGTSGYLAWHRKIAYFKRLVVPGRATDEPKLTL
ncbi:MAG: hypothetical protein HY328_18575 [Chloroflexi bacterium]|nr:hypothetical protein [Chloroflexota bacterium]